MLALSHYARAILVKPKHSAAIKWTVDELAVIKTRDAVSEEAQPTHAMTWNSEFEWLSKKGFKNFRISK